MKASTKFKSLLVLSLTLFFGLTTSAQTATSNENYDQGFRLGFGINPGYVFNDPYGFALGGDARIQYDFSRRTSVTFTTGFTNLFIGDDLKDLGFIPVKAGFKGFIWDDQVYLLGEVGAAIAVTNGYDKTSLLLSPGIGYATKNIDLSLRYEYYGDFVDETGDKGIGQIALRIAYGFKL